jgi:hypothetical protein
MFYLNIISQVTFLVFTRFFKFRTLRERYNLGGNKRYEIDWLEFVQDDFVWWSLPFVEFALCIICQFVRNKNSFNINGTIILTLVNQLVGLVLMIYVFFSKIELRKNIFISIALLHFTILLADTFIYYFHGDEKTTFWLNYMTFFFFLQIGKYIHIAFFYHNLDFSITVWKADYLMRIEIAKLKSEDF